MGLIARQSTAPIVDGEDPSGTEVEAEFDTIFGEINGNLVNANIATGADIDGSKLGENTIPAAQIQANTVNGTKVLDNTITADQMAAAAMPQVHIDSDTGTETTTTSATFVAVPGVTAWTVVPGSTSNFLHLEFQCFVSEPGNLTYEFTFEVDGADEANAATTFPNIIGSPRAWFLNWVVTAPTAASMIVKPRYRRVSGASTANFSVTHSELSKVFRCLLLPVK